MKKFILRITFIAISLAAVPPRAEAQNLAAKKAIGSKTYRRKAKDTCRKTSDTDIWLCFRHYETDRGAESGSRKKTNGKDFAKDTGTQFERADEQEVEETG